MKRAIKVKDFEFEFSNRARWGPTHFKVHTYEHHYHIVWWVFSIIVGFPGREIISVCACCQSPDCCEQGYGDEGLTVCPDCGAIEQGYDELTVAEAEAAGLI